MKPLTKKINPVLVESLKVIPAKPGVYMMLDKLGKVIYIGKARNIKDRVRTYLNPKSWDMRPKLYFMMPKVKEIKTVITHSEKEALILEANLVNKHQPKYNVTLKDDKKFPWLMITYDEEYPRVLTIRDIYGFKNKYPKTKNKFFGPYSDAGAMWETYKIIKEGFQLRLRRKPLFKDRPCMNYHLKLCSGPCQKLISDNDYWKIVEQVEGFLLCKYDVVLKDLKNQMKTASKNLEYEKAAKLRDTVKKIEKVLEKQVIVSDDYKLNQDIFGCYWDEKFMVLELLLVREGKVIAVESFTIELPKGTEPADAFNDGVKQYYTRIDDDNLPNEIVVQFDLKEKKYVEEWLSGRLNKNATVIYPKKGKKLELVKMAERNAKLSLQRVLLSNHSMEETLHATSLVELKQELNLKNYPHRIECFDISHLGGTGTVASMVTFIDGKPEKSEYRKFKIKSLPIGKIDDFASMREIVSRRYRRDGVTPSLPDLIIIDGGKGQLNAAKEALENLQIDFTKIDLISLAKKREEVFKVDKRSKGEVTSPLLLDRKSQALFALD